VGSLESAFATTHCSVPHHWLDLPVTYSLLRGPGFVLDLAGKTSNRRVRPSRGKEREGLSRMLEVSEAVVFAVMRLESWNKCAGRPRA
jgi:hypothetical protein